MTSESLLSVALGSSVLSAAITAYCALHVAKWQCDNEQLERAAQWEREKQERLTTQVAAVLEQHLRRIGAYAE